MGDKQSPDGVAFQPPVSSGGQEGTFIGMASPGSTATANDGQEKLSWSDEEAQRGTDAQPSPATSSAPTFLTGIKLVAVIANLMLSVFLILLDRTIVATALPVIASHFNSLEQGAWIATSYFLTQVGFLPAFGQVLTVTRTKWTFLFSIFLFALGSLMCGVAWHFHALILGRAIAGVGGSGASVSILVVLAQVTKLEQRSMIISSFAVVMVLGNVLGPLLGGALTDYVSWRWCFYINLPLSAITAAVILICLPDTPTPRTIGVENNVQSEPVWKRLTRLDWLGSLLYLGMAVSFLLVLEWGGTSMLWSDPRIVILLCLTVLFLALFLVWEHRLGLNAVLPLVLFSRFSITAVNIHTFTIMMTSMIGVYYLPIYYQVARSRTPTQAGVDVLGFMLCLIVGSSSSGYFIARTGRIRPLMFIGPLIASLISGLIFWALMDSQHEGVFATMIALQVVLALAIGMCMQQGIVFIQAEYRNQPKMIPQASAMANAIQLFGAVIGIAIAGTVLNNRLLNLIPLYAPDLPKEQMEDVLRSAVAVRNLDTVWKAAVERAYTEALGHVFIIGVPAGIMATLASTMMPNLNLKDNS